ncbi:MAG: M56 family metallopeptidase, partial [Candidatus Saccharimonas sp.]|nr:M56 family metallopeptidase [Planctomycetaceae bacterium]
TNSPSSADEVMPVGGLNRDAALPGQADAATKELARPVLAPQESVWWRDYAPLVTSLYLIGVALMGLRLSLGLWGGRRLRRRATPITDASLLAALHRQATALGMRFIPVLAYCERVAVPTVLGILKPMILLPVSLASGLAPDQIESVLAHELAHLRRYDHLVNLMQCVIESVLFFHPAIWWVSRRIRDEREHCCDDLVVACGAVPLDYAASLLRVAELSREAELQRGHTRRRSFAAVSLFATGDRPSTLRQRIARLLGYQTEMNVRAVHPWLLFCLATCCLGAVWVLSSMTWIVLAEINRDRSQTTVVVEWSALVDESVLNEIRALNSNSPRPTSETGAETIRCSADELRAILRGRLGDKKLVTLPSSIRSFWPNDGWSARQRFFTTVAAESIPVGDGFGSVLSVNWHRDGMGTLDERVDGIRLRVDAKYHCQLEGEAPAKPSGKFDELMADGDATVVVVTPPKVPMLFNEVVSDGNGSHAVKTPKGDWKLSAIFVHEAMRLPTEHVELFKPMTTRAEGWIHRGSAGTKEHVARIADWRSRTTQEFATAHNPDWTRELPQGGRIELLGIGHPHLAPLVWWDPTGKPISGDDPNWSDRFPDELIGIVRVSEVGVERCPHADSTSNWKLHRIRESQFAKLPMKRVESGEGRITLQVGAGFGPWTAEAQVAPRDGATVNVNGLEFRVAKVFDFSNKQIHAHFHGEPGQDIDVGAVAVTKTGKVVAPHQDPTIASNEVSGGFSFAFEVPLTEIDHFLIKTRPRHWTEFTGFAIEPAVALDPPLVFAQADVAGADGPKVDDAAVAEFNQGTTEDQKRDLIELRNRIRKVVPKGWQVELRLGGVSIDRPGRQRDKHWVRWPEAMLYFSNTDTTPETPPLAGRTPIASLGLCKLGYATLTIPQPMTAEWPEYRTQLQSVLPDADDTARHAVDAARQSVEPQESWQVVEGLLRYEDGSPMKGAVVGQVGRTKVPVGDDGRYRVRVDPNWGRFFVSLKEARDWPSNKSLPRDPAHLRETLDITVRDHGPPVVRRDITLDRTQLRTVKLLWKGATTKGRLTLYSNPPGGWLTSGAMLQNEKPVGDDPAAVDRGRRLLIVSRMLDVTLERGKQIIINDVPPGDGHFGIMLAETLQQLAWPLTGDDEGEQLEYDPADTGSVEFKMLGEDGKPLKQRAIFIVSRLLPNMSSGVFHSAASDQCELHRPVFDAKTQTHRISHLQPGRYQADIALEWDFGNPVTFEVVKDKAASVVLTAPSRPVGAVLPVEPKSCVAALPDGLKVEFVGITKNTAPAKEGWKPDGLPLGEDVGYWPSTTYRSGHTTGSYIENGEHPEPNAGALDLLFRFRGLKAQPSFRFDLAANGSSYSHLPVKDPYELRVTTERRSPLPGGKWTIPDGEMRIGLTDEPWGKWLQVSPTGEVLNPLTAGDLYRSSYEQVQIERVEPHERAPNKLALVLRQPKNSSSLYAFEIRGIDTDDKQQWVLEWEGRGVEGTDLNESRWGLASPEAKPLVRYEFRLRPYRHWVTFKGVSLESGNETNVKVSVETLPAVVKFPPPNREDVRGLDLSRAEVLGYSEALQQSPDQQTPELLVPGASPSDPWKQPKNVFQMPLAEHT